MPHWQSQVILTMHSICPNQPECDIMFTQAMSSAKNDRSKFSLCLHKRKFAFAIFHRAKPVSDALNT